MKYTAINIGPIINTFAMARRPRELWAASYMFSYLMKCIYQAVENTPDCTIISPEEPKQEKNKIGIYPDRLFFKGVLNDTALLDSAKNEFCDKTGITDSCFRQYFNIMSATCDADLESKAIGMLNQKLDVLELCNYAAEHDGANAVRWLITKRKQSPLFKMESGNADVFPFEINTMAEIATARQRGLNGIRWKEIKDKAREKEREAEKRHKEKTSGETQDDDDSVGIDLDEDSFYKMLLSDEVFKDTIKSHHKYFCIVQADGDNVGKTVSHKDLEDGQVQSISMALVQFGQDAAKTIEAFGGLPIYAGGDDLLFIAPVIGKDGTNIFDLLNNIENKDFKGVADAVAVCGQEKKGIKDKEGNPIEASLSFGVAISYYKYPLYEAFESARNLLFGTAKHISNKKAIAWSFRKHSGGTFNAAFSLKDTRKDDEKKMNNPTLQDAFRELIKNTTGETVVSAVAHKIREKESLLKTVMEAEKDIPYKNEKGEVNERPRLNALFDKVLEFQENDYFKAVKKIMPLLYKEVGEDKFISTLYSLLRTAKFIKGEDLHDEE